MSTTVLLSGKGSNLEQDFSNYLHGNYQIALQSLSTYYSWPNITSANNQLVYHSTAEPQNLKTITIPEGAYDLKSIALVIDAQLEINGDKDAFRLEANFNTLKSIITILKDNIVVRLEQSSLRNVLGWNGITFQTDSELLAQNLGSLKDQPRFHKTGVITKGECSSPNKVNITTINEIMVHCNIINGIYAPHKNILSQQTVLTSFYPNVAPGYKINIEPAKLFYTTSRLNPITNIRVWLTDQDNNLLNNGDEVLTIKLHFKPYNK